MIRPTPFNGLWFEQVIQQNVRPQIEGLKIIQIPVGNGNFATVITIPQSKTVHQVSDGRYYRRRNFRNDIMEDYVIREAFSRTTNPDLYLKMGLAQDPTTITLPAEASGRSMPFGIYAIIGNKAAPALVLHRGSSARRHKTSWRRARFRERFACANKYRRCHQQMDKQVGHTRPFPHFL